jgi:DNA-binding MarR family transcriptional regulator
MALNYFRRMGKRSESAPSGEAPDDGIGSDEMHAGLACTHTSLRRAARRLGQLYDDALAPVGLTSPQALLLSQIETLTAADGLGPTLQVLAGRLAIQISALTHALRPLVRDGLVEVRPDTRDRRSKHAVLTAPGTLRLQEMYERWGEANRRFEAILGSEAARMLRTLSDRIASREFLDAYTDKARETGKPS